MMAGEKHIIPAIIAETQEQLTTIIDKVKGHAGILQLDFMDGVFVPTRSIDFNFELQEYDGIYEAHLMVGDPLGWIEKHGSKIDSILAPIEACDNPLDVIEAIKNLGKKPGFVLNPETQISSISDYLLDIEQVLIMTVNPGYYGSPFLPDVVAKISELRSINPKINIEVDGGITPDTIELVDKAGANMFVSGSYIVRAADPSIAIQNLRDKLV